MNQGRASTREYAKSSHDQSCSDEHIEDGHSAKRSSSEKPECSSLTPSTLNIGETSSEKQLGRVAAPNQPRTTTSPVRPEKFVLVPPAGCHDSHFQVDEDPQDDVARSQDRHQQYLLLPRPTFHTWNSLTMSAENANEVSFSGKSDFSSPSTSFNVMSDNTSRSSGTGDATEIEIATPSSTARLDDSSMVGRGGEPNNNTRTCRTGPPILDFSNTRPFALLPNFTPPRGIETSVTSSEALPKLKLVQRKDQRSNPFSPESQAHGATTVPSASRHTDNQGLSKLPPLPLAHSEGLHDGDTPDAPLLNLRRPSSPSWSTENAVKSPQPEGCESISSEEFGPMRTIGQEVNESSYHTPVLQKGHPIPSQPEFGSTESTSTGLPSNQRHGTDFKGG